MEEKKYFTKFDDPIYKEKILAKIMDLNFLILRITDWNDDEYAYLDLGEVLEEKNDVILTSYMESERYVKYCKAKIKALVLDNESLNETKPQNYEQKIEHNQILINKYFQKYKYFKHDFQLLLKASDDCITEEGHIVVFRELDAKIQKHLTYENAFDIKRNFLYVKNPGENLENLYYRSITMRHNMPCFIIRNDMKELETKIKENNRNFERYSSDTDCEIMTANYKKSFDKGKIYE